MSGILGGGSSGAAPERYAGMQVSTSLQGQVIPYVAGRTRVSMNLGWYGNFQSHGSGSSGKGGGGPSSWTYSTAFIGILSLGPIHGIFQVWHDQSLVTLTYENLGFALGTSGQATWSGYPSNTPTVQKIPYDHLAYVATNAYNLGSSPAMPNLTFEIEGCVPGYSDAHGVFDADPSAVVVDYLTDPVHGAAFQGTIATLTGSTNSYQAYCMSLGLLVSPFENNQRAATDFLKELMQITNSDLVLSCGTLKVIPYADSAVSGTTPDGASWSYTPNLTPIFSFDDSDYCPAEGDEPVKLVRKASKDTYNIVSLEFLDRSNYYNPAPVSASDNGDIADRGPRAMSALTFHQITSATVAKTVAQLILQFQLYELNTYEIRVRADYSLLEPMDYIALTDSALGLANQVCRIVEVDDDAEDIITIRAMEVPGTVRNTPQYNWDSAQGYAANFDAPPGPVLAPTIFQMPPIAASLSEGITLGIAVCAAASSALWGGCQVYCSIDGGSTYQWVGTIGGSDIPRYGTLTSNLSAVADPDTTSTLSIALANTTAQLSTAVTHADADSAQTLLLVGSGSTAEVMAYGAGALVSAGNYNLSYLRRNLYGSVNQAHSSGASFVRLDGSIFQIAMDPGYAGQTVNFKFASFNYVGRATEQLSAVTAYPYTVPSALAVSGSVLLIPRGTCAVNGNSVYKQPNGSAAWDSDAYSPQGFANGCFVSWRAAVANDHTMVGLSANPTASVSFTSLNFGLYQNSGTVQIEESGALVGSFGSYAVGDSFEIRYDGVTIRYFHAGVLIRAVRAPGMTLYPKVVMHDPSTVVSGIEFGPATSTTQIGGNWLTTYPWVIGTGDNQGNYSDNFDGTNHDSAIVMAGVAGAPVGPYGQTEPLWQTVGAGTNANGGWNNNGDLYGIDSAKTYRSIVWIRWNGVGTPQLFHGCDSTYTNDLTGVQNTNPYYMSISASGTITPNKWYLSVGMLHGSGYGTGGPSGISGIYDPATGANVSPGTDYKCIAGAPYQTHRAYQYYANNAGSIVYFSRPRFEEVNGAEPSITTLLSPAGVLAYADNLDEVPNGSTYSKTLADYVAAGIPFVFQGAYSGGTAYNKGDEVSFGGQYYLCIATSTGNSPPDATHWQLLATATQFVATGNCLVSDTNAMKQGGSAVTWDSCVYSIVGYPTCHIAAKPNDLTHDLMIGLTTTPTASSSFTNANYALYASSSAAWEIFESGSSVGFGQTRSVGDVATVTYDGSTITYFINGVSVRTVSASGLTLYGFCPFSEPGSALNSLSFGPTTNLAVQDTSQIGNNAVSTIGSAFSATAATITKSIGITGDIDFITLTVTTTGDPIAVDAGCNATVFTSTAVNLTTCLVSVYRDGVAVPSMVWDATGGGTQSVNSSATPSAIPVTLSITDSPPAGSHTYTLHGTIHPVGTSGTGGLTGLNRFIKVREIKR